MMFIHFIRLRIRLTARSLFADPYIKGMSVSMTANRFYYTGSMEASRRRDLRLLAGQQWRLHEMYFANVLVKSPEKSTLIKHIDVSNDVVTVEELKSIQKLHKLISEAANDPSIDLDGKHCDDIFRNVYDELEHLSNETLADIIIRIFELQKPRNDVVMRARHLTKRIIENMCKRLENKEVVSYKDFTQAIELYRSLKKLSPKSISSLFGSIFERSINVISHMNADEFCAFLLTTFLGDRTMDNELQSALELHFAKILPTMTINQCAFVCRALLEFNVRLKSVKLVDNLIEFICKNEDIFNNNNQRFLYLMLKSLLNSTGTPQIKKLIKTCEEHTEQLDINTLSKLCEFLVRYSYYEPIVLEKIFSKFLKDLDQAILKDFERMFLSLAYFNHRIQISNEDWTKIENRLVALSEARVRYMFLYPHFVHLLSYCVILGFYPQRLINLVFGDKFIFNDGTKLADEYLRIHCSLLMEAPEKYPNVIQPQLIEKYKEVLRDREPHNSSGKKRCLDKWHEKLESLFPGKIMSHKVLAFLTLPDIFIFNDSKTKTTDKSVDCDDVYCVNILHMNNFADRNYSDITCRRLKGFASLKLRLLIKAGYKLYCVPSDTNVLTSKEELEQFRVDETGKWRFNSDYTLL